MQTGSTRSTRTGATARCSSGRTARRSPWARRRASSASSFRRSTRPSSSATRAWSRTHCSCATSTSTSGTVCGAAPTRALSSTRRGRRQGAQGVHHLLAAHLRDARRRQDQGQHVKNPRGSDTPSRRGCRGRVSAVCVCVCVCVRARVRVTSALFALKPYRTTLAHAAGIPLAASEFGFLSVGV